ncbi:MAG: hypothetical protein M1483_01555 [Actinobacteria bacterium]|nr:hypothetical protein [Actinomycetota bacterium]
MSTRLQFRNLDLDPDSPVDTWPMEAIITALDYGYIDSWQRMAREIMANPHGEFAEAVEEAISLTESVGVRYVMALVLAKARGEAMTLESALGREPLYP